jgi:hypothetical protein
VRNRILFPAVRETSLAIPAMHIPESSQKALVFNQFVAYTSKSKGCQRGRFKTVMPIVKITVSKSTYEVDNYG